jgi:hypothetical protein
MLTRISDFSIIRFTIQIVRYSTSPSQGDAYRAVESEDSCIVRIATIRLVLFLLELPHYTHLFLFCLKYDWFKLVCFCMTELLIKAAQFDLPNKSCWKSTFYGIFVQSFECLEDGAIFIDAF